MLLSEQATDFAHGWTANHLRGQQLIRGEPEHCFLPGMRLRRWQRLNHFARHGVERGKSFNRRGRPAQDSNFRLSDFGRF